LELPFGNAQPQVLSALLLFHQALPSNRLALPSFALEAPDRSLRSALEASLQSLGCCAL
jgi:hypothetical protein